ncbi:MAG: PQQ-dependent sugar dehydrogenase [Phycisphaerae bacterium]
MTPRRVAARGALFSVAAGAALAAACSNAAAQSETGAGEFDISTVAEGLELPTAIAAAPDGRLFVAEKSGRIRIIRDGVVQPQPFAEIEVFDALETGLLGLALDPHFAANHYVYAFASITNNEQRILRFTDLDGVGERPLAIKANLPCGAEHAGGGLTFGPNGMLYFSIGDVGLAANAQSLSTLAGKLCRIAPDGAAPRDNPLTTPTGAPSAIYALGFRNPFRFCFAPDGRAFVMDVGSDGEQRREEINIVRAGDNCGWPLTEGADPATASLGLTNPAYAYFDEGSAITGALYYDSGQWPATYRGSLFHLEFVLNRLYRLELSGDQAVRHELFLQLDGGPTDLAQDVDGTVLYCELYTGRVRRIRYVGPLPPALPASAQPSAPTPEGNGGDGDGTDAASPSAAPNSANPGDEAPLPPPAALCGSGALMPFSCLLAAMSLARIRGCGPGRSPAASDVPARQRMPRQ